MAEGNRTFEGLGVPLYGESNIQGNTVGKDILTLTGASGHSGDFLVCQDSTGTELAVIDISGNITGTSLDVTGQLEVESLAVTAIGTFDLSAQNVGTASFSVPGLLAADVVVLSPREACDGLVVVSQVAVSTLTIANIASEAADVEFNYLVIGKT